MLTRWMAVGWWSVLVMAVAFGQLRLPSLISDHMVLQRDMPVRLWGTAAPNERVTVRFRGQEIATTADEKGRWQVTLPPAPAGGPFDLVVRGGDSEIVVRDVLVGEVWVASGQSNMEWPVAMAMNAEQEIAQANDAQIRFFQVPHRVAETPQEEGQGAWRVCSPETVKNFSAVAYFFARELRQHLKVPVGVIQATWGGTPAEAWTSLPTLQSDPAFRPLLDRWAKILAEYPAARQRYEAELQKWREAAEQAKAQGKPVPPQPRPPLGPEHPHRPANLFNGMIAPLTKFTIRGVIWYQGESNVGRAAEYRRLFPAMITDWRKAWGLGDFPFLFVQLANFLARKPEPSESAWAELREAQMFALKLPNTGMATAIDIGDANDIHPRNKQEVGRRLALVARAIAYGEPIVYSGPIYERMQVEGNKVRLFFRHVGSGLACKGEKLTGFAIAGVDGKFVWAEAAIEGDTVVVWSPQVPQPVAVRYAWADNPEVNLYNREGLPALPFRTDAPKE
jgi:sialate O-acetylesterase